jgi:hypothetical protein
MSFTLQCVKKTNSLGFGRENKKNTVLSNVKINKKIVTFWRKKTFFKTRN